MAGRYMLPINNTALKNFPATTNFLESTVYKKGEFVAALINDFFVSRGMDGRVSNPEMLKFYTWLIGNNAIGNVAPATPALPVTPDIRKSKRSRTEKSVETQKLNSIVFTQDEAPKPAKADVTEPRVQKTATPGAETIPEPLRQSDKVKPEPRSLTNDDLFVSKTIEEMEAEGKQMNDSQSESNEDIFKQLGFEVPEDF